MLKREMGRMLGAFLFKEILCQWGAIEEIISDNRTPFVAAVDWLAAKYSIQHIHISAYNSKANVLVERSHRTIQDSLVKCATAISHNGQPSLTMFSGLIASQCKSPLVIPPSS
jgi:hypothetical protein